MSSTQWPRLPLGEVTLKVGSGSTPRGGSNTYKTYGVPLIRSMNVVFFGFKRQGLVYLDEQQAHALKSVEVRADDVLLNITGASIGRVTRVPADLDGARVNQHVCIIRPNAAVDSRFLSAYLSSPEVQSSISSENYGVTRQALTKEQVLDLEIPLPPINEQQRIAVKLKALLDRVDDCRERLDRVPAILRQFRQAVLTSALEGELTEEWRVAQATDQSEWRLVTIDEVGDVGTGSTPLRSNPAFFAPAGTPWVTSAATGNDYIDSADEHVTAAAIAAHRLAVYPPGTLLVAMYGEGKTRGQVSELRIHATINQACAAVRVNEAKALKSFVKLALRAQYEQMRALAEGGNQPNLNLSKVRGIGLRLPLRAEQAEIIHRVEALFALADSIEARYTAAREQVERLTPALLAKAFRGELVPPDPNDEPASELLARLRAPADKGGTQTRLQSKAKREAAA